MKRFLIETWGCQMNEHDSEKIAGVLEAHGYKSASGEADADVMIFNTCTVRDKAAHKLYTRLGLARKLKEENPALVLVVAGCVAQADEAYVLKRAPFVDVVVGPRGIAKLPELLARREATHEAQIDIEQYAEAVIYDGDTIARSSDIKAYITVQEGCDKFCSFCIVPKTRGREVCRPIADIVREAELLVEHGTKEIMLLGQNINSYTWEGRGFEQLLEAAAQVEGLDRLRFVTSHPRDFTEAMMDTMASHTSICKALHFPFQSGSDRILERMRRGYTSESYMEKVHLLRKKIPGLALSTDVIVGFPGETEEDFEATLRLVKEADFEWLYSFKYSPRKDTPAAEFEEQVPEEVASERLQRLQSMHRDIQGKHFKALEGSTVVALVEGPSKKREGHMRGRTDGNFAVTFEGDDSMLGRLVSVQVEEAFPNSLYGRAS